MLLLAFLAFSGAAWAQRALPAEAKRATTGERQMLPLVQLGNEVRRLAPGGVIIDANNRSITHNQLPPGSEVLYQLDRNGEVLRLVILTAEERARIDSAKK
ncbi:MAG: hypothetical protein KF804_12460 [Burkholderiales bacterium]|jgi:hypothetical protein|nr:hypothetical protein [Burkholderiales bacterium]